MGVELFLQLNFINNHIVTEKSFYLVTMQKKSKEEKE